MWLIATSFSVVGVAKTSANCRNLEVTLSIVIAIDPVLPYLFYLVVLA